MISIGKPKTPSRRHGSAILGVFLFFLIGGIAHGNPDQQSIDSLSKSLQKQPDDAGLYLQRGKLYFHQHDFELAVLDFNRAIKLDPKTDEAFFWLGMALGRQGQVREGIEKLSVYIQRRPNDSRAYTKRGVRYLWVGEIDAAERDLRRAIQLDDKNAEAHDDLGVILARRGDTSDAIQHFKTTVRLDPTYQKGFHNLAMAYFLTDAHDSALHTVNQGLRLEPENKNSLLLKSAILDALGRHEEARSVANHAEFLPDGNWSERLAVD